MSQELAPQDTCVLVTGGAGFIGSNFVYHMLNKYPDYRIVCVEALLGDFGHGLHVVGLAQRGQLGKAALAVPQALVEGEKDDLRRGSFD